MQTSSALYRALFVFFRYVFRKLISSLSHVHYPSQSKYQRLSSVRQRTDLSGKTVVFDLERALLKSNSMFCYFMLVAFEAGGLLRAFVLLMSFTFTSLFSDDVAFKIMVMITFFGIKAKGFRIGTAVLPKFFLEDVGLEPFQLLRKGGTKVAVTEFPQLMVESFLKDFLEVDYVIGREIKQFGGYFTGVLEEERKDKQIMEEIFDKNNMKNSEVVGITSLDNCMDPLFRHCKDILLVRRRDKTTWQLLPVDYYPKKLIFHDGRLAFRPTPLNTLAMFMWLPLGILLSVCRIFIALTIPMKLSYPMLIATGIRCTLSEPRPPPSGSESAGDGSTQGRLYVCNHRTLLDPLFISFTLGKSITAVTYSLSRMSEILSPIRTVRMTRDRDEDRRIMDNLLKQGDLAVCPEGTTCREPYLLRFSPLFAEMSDRITPVALDSHMEMFHGTTAGGLKCLDPVLFLMNPCPSYTIRLLESMRGLSTCRHEVELRRVDLANSVQSRIGMALGFECTTLTRQHKYLILAGNDGTVNNRSSCARRTG